ncbi:MAG: hypothetical protein Q7O66_11100, partial [Dehalococcoidia bacterium]|nr:hypothetical protein [Dehalococcoidia bacterium]
WRGPFLAGPVQKLLIVDDGNAHVIDADHPHRPPKVVAALVFDQWRAECHQTLSGRRSTTFVPSYRRVLFDLSATTGACTVALHRITSPAASVCGTSPPG